MSGSTKRTTLHRLANGLGADVGELFADGEMHPAVKSLVESQPALFDGWTAAEFDQLGRQLGNGSTDGEILRWVRHIGRTREVLAKAADVLGGADAELLAAVVELLWTRVGGARK